MYIYILSYFISLYYIYYLCYFIYSTAVRCTNLAQGLTLLPPLPCHLIENSFVFKIYFYSIRVWFSSYTYVHLVSAWCPQWSEEGIRSPGARVMEGCEPPY